MAEASADIFICSVCFIILGDLFPATNRTYADMLSPGKCTCCQQLEDTGKAITACLREMIEWEYDLTCATLFKLVEWNPLWRIYSTRRIHDARAAVFKIFKQHVTEGWPSLNKDTHGAELHGYRQLLFVNPDARADFSKFVLNAPRAAYERFRAGAVDVKLFMWSTEQPRP